MYCSATVSWSCCVIVLALPLMVWSWVSGLAGDKVELVALGVEEGGPTRTVLFDLVGGSGAQREQPFGLGLEVWGDQSRCNRFLTDFDSGTLVERQPRACRRVVSFDYGGLVLTPPTGRGAGLRAWTGSVGGVTAVDVEDMAGDE
jgi:hypothetical protein